MTARAYPDQGPLSESSQNTDALVEAIARRVVDLLAEAVAPAGRDLVDAATVAKAIGKTRDFVYEHKLELGGVPLGDGPRPRWAFDLEEVRERLTARRVSERSSVVDSPAAPSPLPHRRRVRKGDDVVLLPIRGDRRAA